MNRGTFKHIEAILRDYPRIEKYLKDREEELLYPFLETDQNVGGDRSSQVGKPTEKKAITIAEDERLKQLRKQKEAIEYAFETSDALTCEIIKRYYMSKTKKTWGTIAFEVCSGQISISTIKRNRGSFFEKIQLYLGW